MIRPPDFAIWILSTLLAGFVAALIAIRGQFRHYLAFSVYFIAILITNPFWMVVVFRSGIASSAYNYSYIWMNGVLTLLLYCAVAGLYGKTLLSENLQRHVRNGSICLATGLAIVACFEARRSPGLWPTHWIIAYDTYLTMASVLLALCLLYPVLYKEQAPRQVRQMAIVLAGYFVIIAARDAAWKSMSLYARHRDISGLLYLWLPMGVAYVFSEVSSRRSATGTQDRI
ncbi:MAG TPA: hypothetical protein VJW94_18615 [Candidatus Acidoferrum sp.]|nr:hypothetical protein [Candidatus Acidoferrum sp.]